MWRQFSLLGIRPRRRIQVSNTVLAKRFVENGEALALLYRSVALEEAAQGRITILRLPEAPTTVSYWLATRAPDGQFAAAGEVRTAAQGAHQQAEFLVELPVRLPDDWPSDAESSTTTYIPRRGPTRRGRPLRRVPFFEC